MDKELIAQRLIVLRGNRTKEEVAQQLNISIRALESYEAGQRTPRDSVKLAIAQCYHSSVEAIFFQENLHEFG
ncbi:MAG: helix-turn-helix transcriptional regulator [Erysipelothrix sp.]|nr:helix-turn-helix transcriptional regulator [Erysipelothrix sp.]